MKNQNLFTKIVFIGLIVVIVISLLAPAIFGQSPNVREPRQEKLLNGLKVLMWNDPKATNVELKLRIHSGSAFDPQGKEGVMMMLAENIFPNDEARDFFAEDLGGSLDVTSDHYDYIQVTASAKPEHFLTMLETVANAVSNLTIDRETTLRLRNIFAAGVNARSSEPGYAADIAAQRLLFGSFPYGRPAIGTTASLEKVDFADLLGAKARFLAADNATLAISGNFDPNYAYRAVRRTFGGWSKADRLVPSTFKQPETPDPAPVELTITGTGAAEVRHIFRGRARNDKALAAATIVGKVLNARLKAKIPAGSSESVSVSHHPHVLPGWMIVRYRSEAGQPVATIAGLLSEKISDSEFAAARAEFLREVDARDRAEQWLDVDTYKLASVADDLKNAQSVTLADAQKAADEIVRQAVATVILRPTPKESVSK